MDFAVDDPPGKEIYPVETDKRGKLAQEHLTVRRTSSFSNKGKHWLKN